MSIFAKPWKNKKLPNRILAIRLQAMGDLVITLPYLQDLRNNLPPSVKIDLLTRRETDPIPRNLVLFNKVFSIAGKRDFRKQLIFALLLLPRLLLRRYDIVIDLQNNRLSQLIRKSVMPAAWSEFDRTSPIPAGERTSNAIEAIGLGKNKAAGKLQLKNDLGAKEILIDNGWDKIAELVILNPAGVFETRNWPIDYYSSFARLWLREFPNTQFLIIGLPFISAKAAYLKEQLGDKIITLIGKTTVAEAFAILQNCKFMLSEDSGLMHMSWVSGIRTFTLLGGTRPDRAQPLGDHSGFVDSSDLDCGCCMQEKCRWADTRCLSRYTPEIIFEKAKALIGKSQ
ncbi:MAG TPA: glycosyltransferase family 9 protein [Chitinophagaceae bacterium]